MPSALPLVPSVFNYRVGTSFEGVQYLVDVRWNGRDAAWYLDLLEEDETPVRLGMKVVLGAVIGGRAFADADFPAGVLIASDLSNEGRDATFDDLGTRVLVYFYTHAEVAAL